MSEVNQARIYRDRRTKLAKALKTKRVQKHFAWWSWISMDKRIQERATTFTNRVKEAIDRLSGKKKPLPDCGTTACVAGWCPVIFPGSWHMELIEAAEFAYPYLLRNSTGDTARDFMGFFGVDEDTARAICGIGSWVLPAPRPFGNDQKVAAQLADAIESLND